MVSREVLRTGTDNSHPILNLKAPNRELQELSPSLQRLHQRHPQIWAHESHRDTRKASPASDICHPETFRDGINQRDGVGDVPCPHSLTFPGAEESPRKPII